MFFSAKFLKMNPLGLKENLQKEMFKYPALTAPNPRIERILPAKPEKASITPKGKSFELSWEKGANNRMFVIYKVSKKSKLNVEDPANIWKVTSDQTVIVEKNKKTKTSKYTYAVAAISSTHHESVPVVFN